MANGWARVRLGEAAMPRFLVGAGLVAAATYAFVLLSGTELVGGTLAGRYVELLMLGVPAVGLVYGGYWLHDADFDPDQVWRIGLVAVAGTVLATAGTAALVLGLPVLRLDPRASFVLLVSTGTEGALLGVLVGTFAATDRLLRRERAAAAEFEMLDQLLRHNVRNRLTIIGGHLTRLAETPGADGDAVATIEAQLDGIESLLEDTRLATEAVGGTADPEPVDLVAVVREQVRLLQESHDRVAVETDLPERAPVLADDLLGGVVENLLENAVEHADRPTPAVTASVSSAGDRVRLRVADDGPGVAPDRREAVFEAGTGAGTGMGLYLARTVVERYGGTIDLGDNEPRGTVVTVTLPGADAAAVGDRTYPA